jgi:hypothetical protein
MSKINKTKEYAIRYLFDHEKKTPESIASELKIPIKLVKEIVENKSKVAKAKTDKTKELMIRQTSAKKNNSVSIMTEAAAQLSDEFIKNMDAKNKERTAKYIYRPRDN